MVILETQAYEQLDAHRRQIGARTAQLHPLRQRLAMAADILDEIAATAAGLPECAAASRIEAALDRRHDVRSPPAGRAGGGEVGRLPLPVRTRQD